MKKLDYIHYYPVVAGIVSEAEHYLYSSTRNYTELDDIIIDVKIIDYGIQTRYVFT